MMTRAQGIVVATLAGVVAYIAIAFLALVVLIAVNGWHIDRPLPGPGEDFARPGLNGLHTDYYSSGKPYFESQYKDGWKHGMETRKWESGAIMHQGPFVMGKQHGEWKYFYYDGQLRSQITFKDDEPYGPRTFWHESGDVATKIEWRTRSDGSKYLVQFGWYPNGDRMLEGELKDEWGSRRMGVWKVWHEGGVRDMSASGYYGENMFKALRPLTEEEWERNL